MKQPEPFEFLSKAKPNSTVLRPFYWLMAIPVTPIVVCIWKESDDGVLYILLGLLVVAFIVFVIAYFICLFKNPDHLRSEGYNISKMEIENNIKQNKPAKS